MQTSSSPTVRQALRCDHCDGERSIGAIQMLYFNEAGDHAVYERGWACNQCRCWWSFDWVLLSHGPNCRAVSHLADRTTPAGETAAEMLAELKMIEDGWAVREIGTPGTDRLNPWERERLGFIRETIAKAEGKE